MKYQILHGDNRETLKTIPDNSIDAIVTDPPYGIDFLGKAWDVNTGALETYQECLRVLKPGGHILAFSAARTYHHLAITLEQAGFEIRDQIMWIYSSGFPKSQDIGKSIERSINKAAGKPNKVKKQLDMSLASNGTMGFSAAGKNGQMDAGMSGEIIEVTHPEAKAWEGWGTQLKPAHEPIALARKPMKLSIAKNCQTHGVGALNIDATRIPYVDEKDIKSAQFGRPSTDNHSYINTEAQATRDNLDVVQANEQGRFPSNVIGEIPDYQKYFYCPKVSRAERHIGHETPPPMFGDVSGASGPDGNRMAVGFDNRAKLETHDINVMGKTPMCLDCNKTFNGTNNHGACDPSKKAFVEKRKPTIVGNNHPTVKPIELMKYLIRLITPPGGTVLDPFNGSGSTGCAAVELGMTYIGCELDERYVEIADKRIRAWYEHCNPNTFNQLFERAA